MYNWNLGYGDDADDDGASAILINESGLPMEEVEKAMRDQAPELARITRWADSWSGNTRHGGTAAQDRYVTPENIFDQFRTAAYAAKHDDIVSNAIEITEQLAFRTIDIECGDDDESALANQIIDEIDLERRMREVWRELFTVSQCYISVIWERRNIKLKGFTEAGTKRKKTYRNLLVPKAITILDPCKVVPVGNFMFGQERLAYLADPYEARDISETLADKNSTDLIVKELFDGPYNPKLSERSDIAELTGVSMVEGRLFLLNEDKVWRITHTRPAYQRFADVRMVSVFEILDQKNQLRASDRSDLLGNLNCIILVKKGSDALPAKGPELGLIAAQMKQSAKVPLIVSDHRLEIEIVTKKTDNVLRPERYNTLNSSITSRMFQILNSGNYASGTALDDSTKLFKVIAATMEARRNEIKDSFMDHMIEKIWEKNESQLKSEPEFNFYPRRIAVDWNFQFTQMVYDLFIRGDVSRDTMLAELDLSQSQEASKRKSEDDEFGEIFIPKLLPGQAVDPNSISTGDPKADGRAGGGTSNGGGANAKSGQPSPKDQPKSSKSADKSK